MNSYEQRIAKLERQGLLWKIVAVGCVSFVAWTASCTRSSPPSAGATTSGGNVDFETIKAQRIEIIGANDKPVVVITSSAEGGAAIFSSGDGTACLSMLAGNNSGSLDIYNRGKPCVTVGGGTHGGGMIDVHNALDKAVVSIQADKTNGGLIALTDANGTPQKVFSGTHP
ncbi:MAG: hypothetical protein RIC55_26560 [Pirellulaceae bacterium]